MESEARTMPHPSGATKSRRETVERVEAYLRAHIDFPTRVSTLSRIAGLSERGLRDAFYCVHGMSPKQWMVAERLKQVHSMLSDTDSTAISVTGAATRYGFFELGRFAATYKEAFGEVPSETLRSATRKSAQTIAQRQGDADVCTR
jgi:transcriptional regulator GlxA family with amidase domain